MRHESCTFDLVTVGDVNPRRMDPHTSVRVYCFTWQCSCGWCDSIVFGYGADLDAVRAEAVLDWNKHYLNVRGRECPTVN